MTLTASPATIWLIVIAVDLLCVVCAMDAHEARSEAAPILVFVGLFASLIGAAELAGVGQ